MKKLILSILFVFLIQGTFAYDVDVIITKSREQIQCLIISQDDNIVTYKSTNPKDDQIYQIACLDIEKIYMHTEEIKTPENREKSAPEISLEDAEIEHNIPVVEEKILAVEEPVEMIEETIPQTIIEPNVEQPKQEEPEQIETVEIKPEKAQEPKQEIATTEKKENTKKTKPSKSGKASSKSDQEFKNFMGSIYGSIPDPDKTKNSSQVNSDDNSYEKTISIYVLGLTENADVRKIIENELNSNLSMIEEYTARICQAPSGVIEDSIIQLARDNGSKMVCIVDIMPFQDKYYMQTKIISTPKSKKIASTSIAADLSSLEGILSSTKEISNELVKRFESEGSKAKEKKIQESTWYVPGRKIIGTLPPIANIYNQEGVVVVKIRVDSYGEVMTAQCIEGTTITDQDTRMLAIEAALKARFYNSTQESVGTITYVFKKR